MNFWFLTFEFDEELLMRKKSWNIFFIIHIVVITNRNSCISCTKEAGCDNFSFTYHNFLIKFCILRYFTFLFCDEDLKLQIRGTSLAQSYRLKKNEFLFNRLILFVSFFISTWKVSFICELVCYMRSYIFSLIKLFVYIYNSSTCLLSVP